MVIMIYKVKFKVNFMMIWKKVFQLIMQEVKNIKVLSMNTLKKLIIDIDNI